MYRGVGGRGDICSQGVSKGPKIRVEYRMLTLFCGPDFQLLSVREGEVSDAFPSQDSILKTVSENDIYLTINAIE